MNNMKIHFRSSTGFTLIDLMIGLLIGTVIAAALSQLLMISRQSFTQISNVSDLLTNSAQITEYLRANIRNAGNHIVYPATARPPYKFSGINAACCYGNKNQYGAIAAIKGWVYIGYFNDCGIGTGSPNAWRLGNGNVAPANNTSPIVCANATEQYGNPTTPDNARYYFGMECNCQTFCSDPGYNQSELLTRVNSTGDQATYCIADPTYNCGGWCRIDVYQKLIPPVKVITNPVDASKGDQVSVTFAVRSGSGNITNCLGQTISVPGAGVSSPNSWPQYGKITNVTTVPVLVNNSFRVSPNKTLQCQTYTQTNGNWVLSGAGWTDITPPNTVEYMRVMLGVNDGLGTPSMNRTVDPWSVGRYVLPTAPVTTSFDNNSVKTVRVSLVVKSTNPTLTTPKTTPMVLFPATNTSWTPPADLYQRRLVTATIMLDAINYATYPAQCALGNSGTYYVKAGGIPWINGATATDWCYSPGWGIKASNACFAYPTKGACEAGKYTAIAAAQGYGAGK